MTKHLDTIVGRYKAIKLNPSFYWQVFISLLLFTASIYLNYQANAFTLTHASSAATDIFLDNLPVVNVEILFFEGMIILIAFVFCLAFYKPSRIPFLLKSIALFYVVRSFFLILTHLAPPAHEIHVVATNFMERLLAGSGDDLFFSAHTGFPFLMGLVFWDHKYFRWVFFVASAVFGVAVLLGHLHYSIDVFSAYFITYGIFQIACRVFKKDYHYFLASH